LGGYDIQFYVTISNKILSKKTWMFIYNKLYIYIFMRKWEKLILWINECNITLLIKFMLNMRVDIVFSFTLLFKIFS
jgi:hypothetical protein